MGECLQEELRKYEPNLVFDFKKSLKHYRDELKNQDALIIVAINSEDVLMGYQYSYITKLEYLINSKKECVFEAIYVNSFSRGKGVGKALMRYSEKWAIDEKKVDRIKANIYFGNLESESLHVRNGFKPYCTEYIKLINSND
jgi:GNAT superfamily N-acetyltransferase